MPPTPHPAPQLDAPWLDTYQSVQLITPENLYQYPDPRAQRYGSDDRMVPLDTPLQTLASTLEVVEDEMIGPRRPNQVSGEVYAQTQALYDSIRDGQSNMSVRRAPRATDEAHETLKAEMMSDIAVLLATKQGRDLIGELATDDDGNAHQVSINRHSNSYGMVAPSDREASKDGTGTDAHVFYVPHSEYDMRHSDGTAEEEWYRQDSARTLFHELVHAREIHQGTLSDQILWGNAATPDDMVTRVDEYQAVGIGEHRGKYSENAFAAERSVNTGADRVHRGRYTLRAEDPSDG